MARKKKDKKQKPLTAGKIVFLLGPAAIALRAILKKKGYNPPTISGASIKERAKKLVELAEMFYIVVIKKQTYSGPGQLPLQKETFDPVTITTIVLTVVNWVSDAIKKKKDNTADEDQRTAGELVEEVVDNINESGGGGKGARVGATLEDFFADPMGLAITGVVLYFAFFRE